MWVASRFTFWVAYHRSAAWRVVGLTGLAQSLLVLLYVCARFGFEMAGWAGAAAFLVGFAVLEVVLVRHTRAAATPVHRTGEAIAGAAQDATDS